MKNITQLLLFAAVLFSSAIATAQPKPGIKAGVNYAGLSGYDGNKKLSGHGGIFIQWAINKKWKVQPELLFSGEGQHYSIVEAEAEVMRTLSVNFVSLPLMVQCYPGPKFYFEAGPQLSFLVSAKTNEGNDGKANVKRSFRNTSFGLNLGAGFLAGKRLTFFGRYSLGFTDMTLYDNNADCSRVLQAGISFKLK